MGMLKLDAVMHWSIPVNNLEEAENFYGEILGLEYVGRLASSPQSCFRIGDHNIILCRRRTAYAHHRAGWPVASRLRRKPGDV